VAAHTLDPPILRGRRESLAGVAAGSVGLLLLSCLLGFLLPALPQGSNEVRSSNHPFSAEAMEGRRVYLSEGCGACHTQLVRPVVLDAGLGPISLDDTNQVIGQRRHGPDLAAIGSRITDPGAIAALVTGDGDHPSASLTEVELAALVAYLRESR
jgi:cytochrome c oxidase cbb3-type subunit 2